MNIAQGIKSYERFIRKLRAYGFDFEVGKKADAILLEKENKSLIILLSKVFKNDERRIDFEFFGFQLMDEDVKKLFN